jgi:hypothetical protein
MNLFAWVEIFFSLKYRSTFALSVGRKLDLSWLVNLSDLFMDRDLIKTMSEAIWRFDNFSVKRIGELFLGETKVTENEN